MTTNFPKPLDKQVAAISDSLSQTQDGLAIVANGNTHAAISSGQFVYVKNHDTLAEGLYKATAAISANGTLSTSNLTPDGRGGLNDLQSQLTTLSSKIALHVHGTVNVTPAAGVTVSVAGAKCADIKYLRFTITSTSLVSAEQICTVPSDWCPVAARPFFTAYDDTRLSVIGYFILNASGTLFYYGTPTSNPVICCGLYM